MIRFPHFFKIKARPKFKNSDLAGAYIHIWVMAETLEAAESRATHYVSEHLWEIEAVEFGARMQPEQIARLDKPEAANHQNALKNGIAAEIHAWPEKDRPGVC